MNRLYKSAIALAVVIAPFTPKAQVTNIIPINSEFETINSGIWDNFNNWHRWRNANTPPSWNATSQPPDRGYPRAHINNNFDIQFGTTVPSSQGGPQTLGRTFVHAGSVLRSNSDSVHLVQLYTDTLWVDGQFGGQAAGTGNTNSDNWIILELQGSNNVAQTSSFTPVKNYHIGGYGAGVINIYGLRFGQNSNFLVTGNGYTDTLYISNNIGINNGLLTTYYNGTYNHANDNHLMIIDAGKTVSMYDTAAWHQRTSVTTNAEGKETYQIDGTLDMSAATGNTNIVASSITPTSAILVNVNGTVKLGTKFNAVNTAPAATNGTLALNINTGGKVEAIATRVPNSQFMFSNWITNGGKFRRVVGTADTVFPIKTATSVNNSVIIKATTRDTFGVSVRDGFNYTWASTTNLVNKEWSISKSTTGANNITARLMWTTADQNTGFNPAGSISIYTFTGVSWKEIATGVTIQGAGTAASPYQASVAGLDSFQVLVVGNPAVPLPGNTAGVGTIGGNENHIVIAPNPVINHELTINTGTLANGTYNVAVYNAIGVKVASQQMNVNGGKAHYTIALPSSLAAGMYQVAIRNANVQFVQKIVVE